MYVDYILYTIVHLTSINLQKKILKNPVFKSTIYRTRGEHANHYATDDENNPHRCVDVEFYIEQKIIPLDLWTHSLMRKITLSVH